VQEWNALIAAKVIAVSRTYYKVQQKKIHLWPVPDNIPASGRDLVLSYGSLNWVNSGAGVPKENIDQDTDIPVLNAWLLTKLLKVKMWGAKGFDTTALQAEYLVALLSFQGKSKGSRVLSLAPKTGSVFIGVQNVPEGNWIR
jgi:hypothetical protein